MTDHVSFTTTFHFTFMPFPRTQSDYTAVQRIIQHNQLRDTIARYRRLHANTVRLLISLNHRHTNDPYYTISRALCCHMLDVLHQLLTRLEQEYNNL